MSVLSRVAALSHHSMRGYFLAVAAGVLLVVSAFLPWVVVGDLAIRGFPEIAGLWIVGLGVLAAVLASLSIYTRKNSRHPLLIVGLLALGILFLAFQWLERSATESAWAHSQAVAIVGDFRAGDPPKASVGSGIYLGLGAAVVLVLFGLTIVVKRASRPYAFEEDDDVD